MLSNFTETSQSREAAADTRFWYSNLEPEEGLKRSREMMDRRLLGAESQFMNEELIVGISRRLQTAVEKMLMTITDTTDQVQTHYLCQS